MPLYLSALASGSNGNCYYIGNEQEAVLVDVGISAREVVKRMYALELDPQKIKAVFISHEHSDHICGLQTFIKKFKVPVYITPATYSNSRLQIDKAYVRNFTSSQQICIGNLQISAFPKLHDAIDPYSFTITQDGINVGVFTDIGLPCQQVIRHFSNCHAAFLESNYDDEMLANGAYPFYLKRRISGEKGHLSNRQALDLFLQHRSAKLSHLILSHLSKNNNCPRLVHELFSQQANGIQVIVASRHAATEVYRLAGTADTSMLQPAASQMAFSF